MRARVAQHDVGPGARPGALERVHVGAGAKLGAGAARDVVANVAQRRVARRGREHPLQHLHDRERNP